MQDFGRISSFIRGTADLIRDSFRRGHYLDVILPMTVLRRIDCVLAPTGWSTTTPWAMTVCDPCSGTGGMLTVAKEHIEEISDTADVHLYGQEVNPQTFAVTKSDLFMSTAKGEKAENIFFGSSLSADLHRGQRFD